MQLLGLCDSSTSRWVRPLQLPWWRTPMYNARMYQERKTQQQMHTPPTRLIPKLQPDSTVERHTKTPQQHALRDVTCLTFTSASHRKNAGADLRSTVLGALVARDMCHAAQGPSRAADFLGDHTSDTHDADANTRTSRPRPCHGRRLRHPSVTLSRSWAKPTPITHTIWHLFFASGPLAPALTV